MTPGVLLALLVGSVSQAEEPRPGSGAPLTFESSELHDLAGTWGEPLRALMVLPGVSHIVSGASLPVVRGAPPSSTGFYLDGVRVPQLQHLWVGPATLHPELVSGLDFHRGPAPARFGRELGGTVDARLLAPSTDTVRAVATLDLLDVGLLTQIPVTSTGTEFTLAGRFAYTPWLAASVLNGLRSTGPELVLGLFDYQARVTQALGRGSLRLFAFGSSDDAGLRGEGDVVRLGTSFQRVDLRLTHPLGPGEAEAAVTWGRDTLGANAGGDASRLTVGLSERILGARMSWRAALSQRLAVEAGADVERQLVDVEQSTTFRPGEPGDPQRPTVTTDVLQSLAHATFAAAYAQATWTEDRWRLTPGLRVEGYLLEPVSLNQVVFEPRLHARARLSDTVGLRLGGGLLHQPPAHYMDAPGMDAAGLRLGMQTALQFEAGADVRGPAGFTFGADVFVHPLLRTVDLDVLAFDVLANDSRQRGESRAAEGHGYGVELLARRPLSERWSLLASYTFQRRTLRTRVERRDEAGRVLGTDEVPLASALEQTHVFNTSAVVKLPWGLTVGTTLHYNTGAPEAGGLLFSHTQRPGVEPEQGTSRWVPEDRDRVARLPGYFRVDGRVSKTGTLGPLALEAWLDVFNLSLTKETFRYTYGRERGALVRKPFGLPPVTLPSLGIRARY
jgi:hypothetical protein